MRKQFNTQLSDIESMIDENYTSIEYFSERFKSLRSKILYKHPNYISLVNSSPLFGDKEFTKRFNSCMSKSDITVKDVNYIFNRNTIVKNSSIKPVDALPPIGTEIIIQHPVHNNRVAGVITSVDSNNIASIECLSLGGNFKQLYTDIVWYRAERYKTPITGNDSRLINALT